MASTASLAAQHILSCLPRAASSPPLFVALQGPQGSGKTHLTRSLVSILSLPPHSLRLAVLSVDDLYLTHDSLVNLASSNPENRLWKGRGQPGTHDVKLGAEVLAGLHEINTQTGNSGSASQTQVVLPSFDKSKFAGEGDRASEGIVVNPPIDVVIFEGWCVGFYPLTRDELDTKWESVRAEAEGDRGSIIGRAMDGVKKEDIEAANEALRGYVKGWYGFFEAFVQVSLAFSLVISYAYSSFVQLLCELERFVRQLMRHMSIYIL
jgi:D-glycerate 3-kinase